MRRSFRLGFTLPFLLATTLVAQQVTVSPLAHTLTVGDTARTVAVVSGNDSASVTFTGTNAAVFTAHRDGRITARGVGCAWQRIGYGTWTRAQVSVCVVAKPVAEPAPPAPVDTVAPSAPFANEPAGFRAVAIWHDAPTFLPAGWRYEGPNPFTGGRQSRVMLDGRAVLEGVIDSGAAGGYGMGRVMAALPNLTELFIGIRHRLAADYPGSDNSNKFFFLDWGATQVMLGGRFNVPHLPAEHNTWGVTLEDGFEPATKLTTDGTFALGRWQVIELYLKRHADGQRNGIVRLWVDGRLVLDRRDVLFPAGSAHQFYNEGTNNGVRIDGGPRIVPRTARRWTAEMRVSGPSGPPA